MSTTTFVRKFIFSLSDGTTFATRELLNSGPRGAVDKALARLAEAEIIIRVARGIFLKPTYDASGEPILPTVAEIVKIKAQAFGKQLLTHGQDAAHALKFLAPGSSKKEVAANPVPTFTTSGSSTSFLCKSRDLGTVRVHFRSSNPLSKKFIDAAAGLFFRAMRSAKDGRNNHENFAKAHQTFNKQQRIEVKTAAMWMPAWLSNLFWANLASSRPSPKGAASEQTRPKQAPSKQAPSKQVSSKQASPKQASSKQLPSWDFLRKYMTSEEFVDFEGRVNKPYLPPWVEFPAVPARKQSNP